MDATHHNSLTKRWIEAKDEGVSPVAIRKRRERAERRLRERMAS